MITGEVNAFYEAIVPVILQDTSGQSHEFEAIIDTGFNGSLTLPPDLITMLQSPWRTRGSAEMADGSETTFDIYAATVIWDGASRSILVSSVDTMPLFGMRLQADYDLHVRVEPGGEVGIITESERRESAS